MSFHSSFDSNVLREECIQEQGERVPECDPYAKTLVVSCARRAIAKRDASQGEGGLSRSLCRTYQGVSEGFKTSSHFDIGSRESIEEKKIDPPKKHHGS